MGETKSLEGLMFRHLLEKYERHIYIYMEYNKCSWQFSSAFPSKISSERRGKASQPRTGGRDRTGIDPMALESPPEV